MKSALLWSGYALSLLASGIAQAGEMSLPGMIAGGYSANVRVVSIKERRFLSTVRQQYDYSCGSAALATLLTFQYRHPVTEQEVFKEMWDKGNQEKIKREGFSLLDIKEYLQSHGYEANGYMARLDRLVEVGIPAIALVNDNGYNHFVVVKGVQGNRVLVGDPSVGTRILPRPQFEKMRVNGILFVVVGRRDEAVFNAANEWQVRPGAPVGTRYGADNITNVTLLQRSPGDF